MEHLFRTRRTRLIMGLLSGLLLATATIPLNAQPASESRPGRGFGPVYDAAHETTVNGTIQRVITTHTLGSPAGMHLLISGRHGLVDAHIGPFLSRGTLATLQAGMPVRIVGANVELHGKNYLLARELTAAGRTVTVRSKRGVLIRAHSARVTPARIRQSSQPETNGGAR